MRAVGREQPLDVGGRRLHVLGRLEDGYPPSHHLRELREALAVRAVDQHQHVAVARHERVDRTPRPRTCRCPASARTRASLPRETIASRRSRTPGGDRVELRIPRAPVAQHRHLGGERRRQRPGRQEDRIAAEVAHAASVASIQKQRSDRRRRAPSLRAAQ